MEYKAKHRFADMNARKIRQFADLIRTDLARWAKVIKTAGITAE